MSAPKPAEVRKGLIALGAFLAQLVALGVVPDRALPYVSAVLAALAAVGVYVVPNESADPVEGDDLP